MGRLCIQLNYTEISTLHATIANEHYPSVVALANELSGGVPSLKNQLNAYAKACVKPAYDKKFGQELFLLLNLPDILIQLKLLSCSQ